jgi:hypothetical protein
MKDIRCNYMMGEPHGQRNRSGIVVSQNSKRAVTGPASNHFAVINGKITAATPIACAAMASCTNHPN